MNELYLVSNLLIGNTFVSSNLGGNRGPINMTSNETYIFYKKNNNKNIFIEIFTEDKFYQSENEEYIFNNKYIVNSNNINIYLTEQEIVLGKITKYRLLEIYNQINFRKQNHHQKQLQK